MTYQVQRICSWCNRLIGYATFDWDAPGATHVICPACREKYFPQRDRAPRLLTHPAEPAGDLRSPRAWSRWARYALACLILATPASAGMIADAQQRIAIGEHDDALAAPAALELDQHGWLWHAAPWLVLQLADQGITEYALSTDRASEANPLARTTLARTGISVASVATLTLVDRALYRDHHGAWRWYRAIGFAAKAGVIASNITVAF